MCEESTRDRGGGRGETLKRIRPWQCQVLKQAGNYYYSFQLDCKTSRFTGIKEKTQKDLLQYLGDNYP